MRTIVVGLATLLCICFLSHSAEAHSRRHQHHHRHYHNHHRHVHHAHHTRNHRHHVHHRHHRVRRHVYRRYYAVGRSDIGMRYLSHPAGCPRTNFSACGASVEIFGHPIRALWPSRAWLRFPRAFAAPRMAAVRPGHVFVLEEHVRGDIWWVKDYNSGGHRSRYHMRSIRGYRIVDPMSSRYASRISHAL